MKKHDFIQYYAPNEKYYIQHKLLWCKKCNKETEIQLGFPFNAVSDQVYHTCTTCGRQSMYTPEPGSRPKLGELSKTNRGTHADLIWIDESEYIPDDLWETTIMSLVMNPPENLENVD